MADSCRPVSRHGRYHAPGRNISRSGPYNDDIPSYSTIDYVDQEDVYKIKQQAVTMDTVERPKTSKGRQNRPKSRMGRPPAGPPPEPPDDESPGRPVSRRGYTPETYQRHDYDEFSRQVLTLDSQISSDESSCSTPPLSPGHTSSPVQRRPPPAGRPVSRGSPFGRHASPASKQTISGYGSPGLVSSPQQRPPSAHRYQSSPSESFNRYSPMDKFDRASSGDNSYFRQNRKMSGSSRSSASRELHRRDQSQYVSDDYSHERPPSPSGNFPSARESYDGYYINQDTSNGSHQHIEFSHNYEESVPDRSNEQQNRKQRYSARAKSGKKRRPPSSAKRKSKDPELSSDSVIENLPSPANMRPMSSLTRYKLLPAIGTPQPPQRDEICLDSLSMRTKNLELNNDEDQSLTSFSTSASRTSDYPSRPLYRSENDFSDETKSKDISREVTMSSDEPENRLPTDFQEKLNNQHVLESSDFKLHKLPSEPGQEETRILLAVRLLTGSRKQRYFRVTDSLQLVLMFAENSSCCDLSDYDLVRNMPRVVFTDLTVLVGEAGLEDRTVLYLEEKES